MRTTGHWWTSEVMKECDYVYFNLEGKSGSRSELRAWERAKLRAGRFMHWVDPCTLREGHDGPHHLATMPTPPTQVAA